MIRFAFSILLICLVAVARPATAEEYRRTVNLELDAVEGAISYQIEIKNVETGKTIKRKMKEPVWTGKLTVGSYEMRVRAFDYRGIPGDWSTPDKFDVGLEKVKLLHPEPGAKLTGSGDSQKLEFKWQEIGAVKDYDVEITSNDGTYKKTKSVSGGSFDADVPVAQNFTWKVTAHGPSGLQSETTGEFTVYGGKLDKPALIAPKNEFVRELNWAPVPKAQSYGVRLLRLDRKAKKWEEIHSSADQKENALSFSHEWPGGVYRLKVLAHADKYAPSDTSSVTFKVRDGDRSPEAEWEATIRDSILRYNGWYGVGSYMLTMIQYTSTNYDQVHPASANFNGIGGTVSLGAGYLKKNATYGFYGSIADAGFLKSGESHPNLYNSAEADGVRMDRVGHTRGEFRTLVGVFYQEMPVATGNPISLDLNPISNANFVGPHLGFEYLYPLSPKFGLQALIHIYDGIFNLHTPNGQPASAAMTTQLGLRGSYRLTPRITGLAGIIQRNNSFDYGSVPGNPNGGQTNTIRFSETSMNLILEYNF